MNKRTLKKRIKAINNKPTSILKVDKELDYRLEKTIRDYNNAYKDLNYHGKTLFKVRQKSVDLLDKVEELVNSIANTPKEFEKKIEETHVERIKFKDTCDFAKQQLTATKKSGAGAGAGVAGGAAVAAMAPSAAMWVATTFGTASTGTAISTLSGAAATNAAIAWLGGGAAAAGGGGMAAGNALLALAGPIGLGVAGVSVLTSVVLIGKSTMKIREEKRRQIESIMKNTSKIRKINTKVATLKKSTDVLYKNLSNQYTVCKQFCGKTYTELQRTDQEMLRALVNNSHSLGASLSEGIEVR